MTENHWVLDQAEIMHHIFGEPLSNVQCTKILPPKIAPIFEDFCVQRVLAQPKIGGDDSFPNQCVVTTLIMQNM